MPRPGIWKEFVPPISLNLSVVLFYPSITLCESGQHGAQPEQKQRPTEREEQQQGGTKSKEQKQVCMANRNYSFLS